MDLELSMTKLRAEEASLRDSLSKLSALNESLAQDKLGLNHLVAQVCRVPVGPPALPSCAPHSETPLGIPGPALAHILPHHSSLCSPLSLCLSVLLPASSVSVLSLTQSGLAFMV